MHKAELFRAIDLASNGNWNEAHHIVQQFDDRFACWIHAVLHKIEGDEGNSRYWYARAGKAFEAYSNHEEELRHIKNSLLDT
ncbi:MAG TPA: hypothetical protein VNL69_10695 [Bacteroidota bacterium]|nr:hypothetical protein [Bacteroidota bacterium]